MSENVLRKTKYFTKDLRFKVNGGLNYIRGNKKPYFTITVDGVENGSEFGGCNHELILKYYPEFSDLVSLHLSDIDGIPMYAVENGYFWLTALQGDNQYEKDPGKDYLKIFSEYMRISRSEARSLSDRIKDKKEFSDWCESQKSRWKKEANDCIAKHNLKIFGDFYKSE